MLLTKHDRLSRFRRISRASGVGVGGRRSLNLKTHFVKIMCDQFFIDWHSRLPRFVFFIHDLGSSLISDSTKELRVL